MYSLLAVVQAPSIDSNCISNLRFLSVIGKLDVTWKNKTHKKTPQGGQKKKGVYRPITKLLLYYYTGCVKKDRVQVFALCSAAGNAAARGA